MEAVTKRFSLFAVRFSPLGLQPSAISHQLKPEVLSSRPGTSDPLYAVIPSEAFTSSYLVIPSDERSEESRDLLFSGNWELATGNGKLTNSWPTSSGTKEFACRCGPDGL